ncbi:MAG: ATP-binding cassette domain-containing protein [Alphaproteobacteria bacterium]|nr:ATP-binding cassette domain-containing protein [Alphaproteobacteria bacterium]
MSDDYFDDESPDRPAKASVREIARYMWRHWRSQPGKLAAFGALFGLSATAELMLPFMAQRLVNALTQSEPGAAPGVMWAYGAFALVAFVFFALRNIAVRFWIPFASNNMRNLVQSGFKDVQRFSADWHANNFAGATVRRVSRAMWAYDTISDTIAWFVLPAIIVLVGITVSTAIQWPMIGVFVAATIVAFFASVYFFGRYYIARVNRESNAADTAIGAALADAVGSNATVKAFGAESREEARFNAVAQDWRDKANRTWMRFTNAWIVQNLLLFALQAGVVGLVVLEWAAGRANAGDAAFALTSFFLVNGYLRVLGENFQMLQKGFAEIEDVVAYSKQSADIVDAPHAADFKPGAGAIAFERVSFRYNGQETPLYSDFSLTISPGETVALVGPTGSGKSTFVKLVQRLYDVNAGAILIDGQDVRDVRQASLRRAVALVPQDPALFHRSLKENIAYADPDAPLERVIACAKRARAHDFIMRLPKGYDTEVGERGVKLSGGERQRVALARAFLADAPVLILDEATSSLDTETERDVQAAMAELMAGRTTIVIAHRLSTVREADRILVFDHGRIVEQGAHADLVRGGGLYARLHALSVGDKLVA